MLLSYAAAACVGEDYRLQAMQQRAGMRHIASPAKPDHCCKQHMSVRDTSMDW